MDNLTHSLVGAALAQAGLKRKTAMAMPALIIAANLPDIDATCTIYGIESLAMRRGLTHGPIALLVLPVLLTGLMILWDRWRRRSAPDRPAVHAGWLLALAYIGTLSHPALDWLNNYGIRLLEPFSSEWFYGDTLFIIDVWILAMLGTGVWMSLRRERAAKFQWTRPARAALIGALAYIGVNMAITARAESWMKNDAPYAPVAVANAVPVAFWQREVLWRTKERYGSLPYSVFGPLPARTTRAENAKAIGVSDLALAAAVTGNRDAKAFSFWSRMPIAQRDGDTIVLRDQRFDNPLIGDRFSVRVPVKEQP
jgi:inner membrane protein